jgi:hypothetical protein
MAKIVYTVQHVSSASVATTISTSVLSMNIRQGREKYLDTYSGGSCTLTINNNTDFASNIKYGDLINMTGTVNGSTVYSMRFYVQQTTFNDYPGNTGLSTATIQCSDWLANSGRINVTNLALTQATTCDQFDQFVPYLPAKMVYNTSTVGASIAAAQTYTGTILNYLNYLAMTERGLIYQTFATLVFIPRTSIEPPSSPTIGPTTSSTQIGYQTFNRYQNGQQFINTVTTNPTGLAAQTSTNSTSVTTYGPAFYSVSTVDYNTTQALGNSDWVANNFSDISSLYFAVSFTDVMQNATALQDFIINSINTRTLQYRPPGGSLTSLNVVPEGFELNVRPEQTTISMTFSPLTYYQYFTLDSSTLGILDTSRLGW